MATLVGTQSEFNDVVKELIEIDYDAVEAYEVAIERLKRSEYKQQLECFKEDHQRHIKELNHLLNIHNEKNITGPSGKQWLTKGKVMLSNLVGDDFTILQAMHSNEEDTNVAYERANKHEGKWSDGMSIIEKALEDERNHKRWIEKTLAQDKS